jgi:hypothetical protein
MRDPPLAIANLIDPIGLTVMDEGRHGERGIEDPLSVWRAADIVP